jgi:tetratricopeptide (TPR) repeat protein
MKKPDRAAENWAKAVRYGEDDPEIIAGLAALYSRAGKIKDATLLYEKIAARKPTEDTLNKLVDLYTKAKNYSKAIAACQKLIKLNPARGYSAAAYVYGLKGDTDRQIEYYRMSLKYDPEDHDAYARLGAAYEKKGLLEEALKAYTIAYQLNPDAGEVGRNIPRIKIMLMRRNK